MEHRRGKNPLQMRGIKKFKGGQHVDFMLPPIWKTSGGGKMSGNGTACGVHTVPSVTPLGKNPPCCGGKRVGGGRRMDFALPPIGGNSKNRKPFTSVNIRK